MLKKKDLEILYELDRDGRQSYRKIGRKLGMSKDVVAYRVAKMKQKGVIKAFSTVLDVGKLGILSFRLDVAFRNTTPEVEENILEFFKSRPEVGWIVSVEGEYNLRMWVMAKHVDEMVFLWKDFSQKFSQFIEEHRIAIFTRVVYYPRAYLASIEQNLEQSALISTPTQVDLSEKDLEILKILAKDARASSVDIARTLGVTAQTVISRMRALEREKVIVGYRVDIDVNKLGYEYFKVHFMLNSMTADDESRIRGYIKQHPNTVYDNEVLGGDTIEVEVQFRDLTELRKFIDEFRKMFQGLIRTYTYMRYREHKFSYFPD